MDNIFNQDGSMEIDREKIEREREEKARQAKERDAHLAEQRRERETAEKAERVEREAKFRADCRIGFLEANAFATESDFARLYDKMRDEILLENWRQNRQDSREAIRGIVGKGVGM